MFSRAAPTIALGAAGALIFAAACYGASQTDVQKFEQIKKGRYLAEAADCAGCHTIPERGSPYAGGRAIETPFGDIISRNITPDRETGIGNWSDDDFDRAVRQGIRSDGSRLYPAMPYPSYTKMSRDDVKAIRAYLNTIPSVHTENPPNTLPFPFNIRTALRVWDMLYFTKGAFQYDPQKSVEWNRGAYLVQGPGHCGACHTPKSFLGGDKTDQYLRGANLQGWSIPNITDDPRRGIGRWSVDDIAAYLKTGHNRITAATGPMAEEVTLSSSHMTDADLKAIATYLKSVPGADDKPAPVAVDDPAMKAGRAIYRDVCSACHGIDGKGVPNLFPSLADASVVRSDDPTSAIRMVLRGARSVATAHEPTAPGMPAFSWQLNDMQIASVLTYVRNGFGSAAPAVSADDVGKARKDLRARTD
jgi:mono/diheme cytochrome c family protein